jgi:AcrR family transcriptional regulator
LASAAITSVFQYLEVAVPVPSAPAAGRRDATRERLLAAARALFVARGYHLTRPQDIAREAGLGHGTFYLYFPDKKACFLAFVAAARLELEQFMEPRLVGADRAGTDRLDTFFAAMIGGMLDYAAANPGVLRAALADNSAIAAGDESADLPEHWAANWASMLGRAMKNGRVYADYDPGIVGAVIVGAIGGAMAAASRGAAREEVIANGVRFLLRALRPAEGGTIGDVAANRAPL